MKKLNKKFSHSIKPLLNIRIIVSLFILLIVFIIFINNVVSGLTLFEFGDETEKFVAAKLINNGSIIYKDIFAHHGLVPYLFVHLYTNIISDTNFTYVRLINFFLAIISAISILLSPIFEKIEERLWALIFYFSILAPIWLIQCLHLILYHSIGGFLFVVPLMHLALPTLLGKKVNKYGSFFSGFAIVFICFTSYSFGIAVILLFAGTLVGMIKARLLSKKIVVFFIFGVIIALLIALLWLFVFGDPIGYIAYHFYFNQKIYIKFVPYNLMKIFENFQLKVNAKTLVHLTSVSLFVFWGAVSSFFILRQSQNGRYLRLLSFIFILFSVLFLNPFGTQGFKNTGFLIGNIALFSSIATIFIGKIFKRRSLYILLASLILLTIFMNLVADKSVSAVHHLPKSLFPNFHMEIKPSPDDEFMFIREVTGKEEKILSLVFNPIVYVKADRLPASGHYYYLPWQAAYAEEPFLNYNIDICEDVEENKPKLIWFDNWKVWNRYAIEAYEPCITEIISDSYTISQFQNLYIRNK